MANDKPNLTGDDLIQPGPQNLNQNNLIDTVGGSSFPSYAKDIISSYADPFYPTITRTRGKFEEYDKYIKGRPWSINESDIDDIRAQGQSFGEKFRRGWLAKLPVHLATNIAGSTVGLFWGLGELVGEVGTKGFHQGWFHKFFDNDFQRGLDSINESLDKKLPHYYTQQEHEMNVFKAAFGPGAANFWTNDFTQGLAFVAGAVLSEMTMTGAAKALLKPKAMNKLKRTSKLKDKTYTKTTSQSADDLTKINNREGMWNSLVNARRLATGAFYEAGVEARHNYDETIQYLTNTHIENFGRPPTEKEKNDIKQTSIQMSNVVFAANAALVGYSNWLMFPRIFGPGMRSSHKNIAKRFRLDVTKDVKKWVPKYKDHGKFRSVGEYAWGLLRRPLYEGFGEEGGQRLANIAGQHAADYFYTSNHIPSANEAIGELINHTYDSFAEAYFAPQGQKEIFLGFVLAAMGLPSFTRLNTETGKRDWRMAPYTMTGGMWQSHQDRIKDHQYLSDFADEANKHQSAFQAISTKAANLRDQKLANDQRDFAIATNDDYGYKNADHDAFFAYVWHKIRLNDFGDVIESIKEIENMSNQEFRTLFDYENNPDFKNAEDKDAFLSKRKREVAESHIKRAEEYRKLEENTRELNISEEFRKLLIHAHSSALDSDEREASINDQLKNTTGRDIIGPENKADNDKQENENLIQRLKNFTLQKLGFAAKEVLENSETGKEIKQQKKITEFTDPADANLVGAEIARKMHILSEKAKKLEEEGKIDEAFAALEEHDKLMQELITLKQGMVGGILPDLSAEERQYLEEYRQRDEQGYLANRERITKLLQDSRHLRARRHRALNLVNQLLDPSTAKDKIQQTRNIIFDLKSDSEDKTLEGRQKDISGVFKGNMIEFDYTKQGDTESTRYRVMYKENSDKGLIRLPKEDTYKLIRRKKALENKRALDKNDQAEYDLIVEELKKAEHITEFKTMNASILSHPNTKNIRGITQDEIQLEGLNTILEVLLDPQEGELTGQIEELEKSMTITRSSITLLNKELEKVLRDIETIKNKGRANLVVNLQAYSEQLGKEEDDYIVTINRRGRFGLESAKKIADDIQLMIWENEERLDKLIAAKEILDQNTTKIKIINDLLAEKEPTTFKNAMELVRQALELVSDTEIINQIAQKDFFDNEDLVKILTEKAENLDLIDKEVIEDLLNIAKRANKTQSYIDNVTSRIDKLKQELKTLKSHYTATVNILSRMRDPQNTDWLLFPQKSFDKITEAELEAGIRQAEEDMEIIRAEIRTLEKEKTHLAGELEGITNELTVYEDLIEGKIPISDINKLKPLYTTDEDIIEARQAEAIIIVNINDYIKFLDGMVEDPTETQEEDPDNPAPAETESMESFIANNNLYWDEKYKDFRHSPSILEIPFTKTAGNHGQARADVNMYEKKIAQGIALSDAENRHYKHALSQTRFYKATEGIHDWSANGNKLLIVHRYNIPTELEDKILFYDILQKQKDEQKKKPSKDQYKNRFKYAKDLLPNENREEEYEDIKVVIVDKDFKPVLIDGEIAYTNIPATNLFITVEGKQKYKYAADKDLKEDGTPLDAVEEQRDAHIRRRQTLLTHNNKIYFKITGKSKGYTIKGSIGSVLGRIVTNPKDIKNIKLITAIGKKGSKRASINIGGNVYSVKNGMPYFAGIPGPVSKGVNNNLVEGYKSIISDETANNIYNIFRVWATRQRTIKDVGEASNIAEGKGIHQILSDIIYFGNHTKKRALQKFTIYMSADNQQIHFGYREDEGMITVDELMDPSKKPDINEQFRSFLKTLIYHHNSKTLDNDAAARNTANKELTNAIKKEKDFAKKQQIRQQARRFPVNYTPFIEVVVDDDLKITTREWSNYTEYLISPFYPEGQIERELKDIPIKANIPILVEDGKVDKSSLHSQFYSMYLTYRGQDNTGDPFTESTIKKQTDTQNNVTEVEVSIDNSDPSPSGYKVELVKKKSQMTFEQVKAKLEKIMGDQKAIIRTNADTEIVDPTTGEKKVYKAGDIIYEGPLNMNINGQTLSAEETQILIGDTYYDLKEIATWSDKKLKENIKLGKGEMPGTKNINDIIRESQQKDINITNKNNEDEDTGEEGMQPFFHINMLQESNLKENALNSLLLDDLDTQAEWYNNNMPKDENGNFLIPYRVVKGLIEGKALGRFTKNAEILMSHILAVPGLIYHESFHAITRRFMSREDRHKLYDTIRKFRGKGNTYTRNKQGDFIYKKLSEFTNKEADEWLAEEFRTYVLADGNYKVGQRTRKSLIDRFFDMLSKALNWVLNSKSDVETLFSRIHGGYYTNPNTEITIFDVESGADYTAAIPNEATIDNMLEGLTVMMFNIASQNNIFQLSDIWNNKIETTKKIKDLYGTVNDINDKNKLIWHMDFMIRQNHKKFTIIRNQAKTSTQITYAERELEKLRIMSDYINDETFWNTLLKKHELYLKKLYVDLEHISDEQAEEDKILAEDNKTGNQSLDQVSLDINPNSILPKAVKLVLATLPKTNIKENKRQFVVNDSGFPALVDFGNLYLFLHKRLTNTDPLDIINKLKTLSEDRNELVSFFNRIGFNEFLEGGNISDDQSQLIIQTLVHFDQSFRTSYVQNIEPGGKRYLVDSNSNRVQDKIKQEWKEGFKRSKVYQQQGNKYGIDPETKFQVENIHGGKKSLTLKEWATQPLDEIQAYSLLASLGITFSNANYFKEKYKQDKVVFEAVKWVINSISENPLSDLYEGDIRGRLKTLIDVEKPISKYSVDLSVVTAEGKVQWAVSLKTAMDKEIEKLNSSHNINSASNEHINYLLSLDNLRNSVYLNAMKNDPGLKMQLNIFNGINPMFSKGKDLSKWTNSDIAHFDINALFRANSVAIIKTADKKTQFALGFNKPIVTNQSIRDSIGEQMIITKADMIDRYKGYLFDEIRTANKFNTIKTSRLRKITTYKDYGGKLRYFNGIVNATGLLNKRGLKDTDIINFVNSEKVIESLTTHLNSQIQDIQELFIDLQVVESKIIVINKKKQDAYYNIGLDINVLNDLKKYSNDDRIGYVGNYMSPNSFNILAEQFIYNHTTSIIEQSKLFLGDLALYEAIFKRAAGLSGTKQYATSDPRLLEILNRKYPMRARKQNGNIWKDHSNIMKVATKADLKVDSAHVKQYVDVMSIISPEMANFINNTYRSMNEFDGGAFMHFDSYRSALLRVGLWSNKQENIYNKIMDNEPITNKDLAYLPPIKPQTFASFVEDNIRLKAFDKYAIFPLISQLMPGRTYDDIVADMTENEVDVLGFESTVKVGAIEATKEGHEPFYKKEGNYWTYQPMLLEPDQNSPRFGKPLSLREMDFSDFGFQVSPSFIKKEKVTAGTQSSSMLPLNIFENGLLNPKYIADYEGNETDFINKIAKYHGLINELTNEELRNLINDLGLEKNDNGDYIITKDNANNFKEKILRELQKRDLPDHVISGVNMLFNQDSKFLVQTFNKDRLESILYSIVTNSVIKRKMKGDMMFLQAVTGMEKKAKAISQEDFEAQYTLDELQALGLQPLQFYRKELPALTDIQKANMSRQEIADYNLKMANGRTLAAQVYLPHSFKEFLGEELEVGDIRIDPELLQLIGFRIPTEGLNSIEFMEIAGFLPQSYGSRIIVPTELVKKAGSDYDADKLTLYFPNYKTIKDENNNIISLDKIRYIEGEKNGKLAIQNEIQDLMRDILSHPLSFEQLITPVGAFRVEELAEEVRRYRQDRGKGGKIQSKLKYNEVLSYRNINRQTKRMWDGIGGTGILAVGSTGHAKAQIAGLQWSDNINGVPLELNFYRPEGTSFKSLSRVKDIEQRNIISKILGEYITGYVDVTNNDFIFDINAGKNYAPLHVMLHRSGVPLESVVYFMSQPIIDDYIELRNTKQSMSARHYPGTAYQIRSKIEKDILTKYGFKSPDIPVRFREESLRDMIGRNVEDLSERELALQVQVFKDFLRYEEYSNALFELTTSTKYDTARLKNPFTVMYMEQSLLKVLMDGYFEQKGVDNLTNDLTYINSIKNVFNEAPKLFHDLDFKEYHSEISNYQKKKIQQLLDPTLKLIQDDIVFRMERFDNFIAEYIIQNTVVDNNKLRSRIKELFQGENSLPRRIRKIQQNPEEYGDLADNKFMDFLYPLTQAFASAIDENFSIDNLQPFGLKLDKYDIDVMTSSFREMKAKYPQLAQDLIEFSLLQSGLSFSPISFSHLLPSTEVLKLISPRFDRYTIKGTFAMQMDKTLADLWELFHRNYSNNGKLVTQHYFSVNDQSKQVSAAWNAFIKGEMVLNKSDEYLNIIVGLKDTAGNKTTVNRLFKLVKRTEVGNTYKVVPKLGQTRPNDEGASTSIQSLIETTDVSLLANNAPIRDNLKLTNIQEKALLKNGEIFYPVLSNKIFSNEGFFRTKFSDVQVNYLGNFNKQGIETKHKSVIKNLLQRQRGKAGLNEFAKKMGYDTWDQIKKDHKELYNGKFVVLYKLTKIKDYLETDITPTQGQNSLDVDPSQVQEINDIINKECN